ncbi:threonylcarbamoyl-AMP synthase [Halobacteriales archaeon QS_5_70_15]|nr:MAG: threonylcarbamoyl-AMP synthase [Halobacteriales archaeon QS_5_70_15]
MPTPPGPRDVNEDDVAPAGEAIREGDLVVYPTDTVYGLGADALDTDAIARAFELKGRARDRPLSLGVPDVDAALDYADPTDREERFMREFLPGPVTVVADRPVTATSANLSGEGSARRVAEVARSVREAAVVLDAGETPGTESTVVDPSLEDPVIREGAEADAVRAWLRD